MIKRCIALVSGFALLAGLIAFTALPASAAPVSAGAGVEYFVATLTGSQEVPPVSTTATGTATFTVNAAGTAIAYEVTYADLSGAPTAAHIHVGPTGIAGSIILPLPVGASPMTGTLTAADFTPAVGVATFADALAAIRSGGTYVNIHTAAHPGGEIRGQIVAAPSSPQINITADMPSAVPKGHNWGFNDYFPRTVTVAQGSSIRFDLLGFHTITLLPVGMTPAADLASAGGSLLKRDTDDTGRNRNGTTHTLADFSVLGDVLPSGGCDSLANPCTFDGTTLINKGPFSAPGPFVVIISAPLGTYYIHCRLHTGMVATIKVVAPGSGDVSTPAQVAAAVAAQIRSDVVAGRQTEAKANHVGLIHNRDGSRTWIVSLGAESPGGYVSIMEMLPRTLHVKRGDRVTWRLKGNEEPHTVTFPGELHSDFLALCEGSGGADTPAIPNHNPPQGPVDFSCGGRPFPDEVELGGGNGVTTLTSPATISDSGVVAPRAMLRAFGVPASSAPASWTVRIGRHAALGTYHYLCQIHGGMEGTIVVTR